MRQTIRERLFDIAVEIEELTNKEHLTLDEMTRMNDLIQESSQLQAKLLANGTKSIRATYGV
jgi:hypothetical protein